jgi:hypothetical protein
MFITVLMADQEEQLIHVDDISVVKSYKVNISRKSAKQVDGCIIERRSCEFSLWCIEPKEEIFARLKHAGAVIVRERESHG